MSTVGIIIHTVVAVGLPVLTYWMGWSAHRDEVKFNRQLDFMTELAIKGIKTEKEEPDGNT